MARWTACIVGAVLQLLLAALSSAADLVPQRALFELALVPGGAPGVVAVGGRIAFEYEVVCDGAVTRHARQLLVRDALGKVTEVRSTARLWERADGGRYDLRDDQRLRNAAGPAVCRPRGAGSQRSRAGACRPGRAGRHLRARPRHAVSVRAFARGARCRAARQPDGDSQALRGRLACGVHRGKRGNLRPAAAGSHRARIGREKLVECPRGAFPSGQHRRDPRVRDRLSPLRGRHHRHPRARFRHLPGSCKASIPGDTAGAALLAVGTGLGSVS
ncbi:MAG: DUF1849 family protein [Alphaproteobacteria bacterium]|nr:DUF1849 family protein [Alphaproteobacteria bacterium]